MAEIKLMDRDPRSVVARQFDRDHYELAPDASTTTARVGL